MRIFGYAVAAVLGLTVGVNMGQQLEPKQGAPADKLTALTLRNMAQGLGYEVKVLNETEGKEKYEIKTKTANLDVPIGLEISPSTNYIWLTVFLGENNPSKKHEDLLKENANLQPTFFYITSKNNLMAAEAIDNRDVSSAILKRCLEKLSADIDKTSKVWGDSGAK
ncbi:MAG: hypothetical protein GC165_08445 [Armatimonadetes bacterium]|nr:hypothetical protein [Armatimonadota bacterium]